MGDNNNMATEPIAQVLSRYFFVWTHLYVFEDCRSGGGDFLPHLIFSAGMSSVKEEGHSGDFGNAAKMVGKMSKLVMQLISIGFLKLVLVSDNENSHEQA